MPTNLQFLSQSTSKTADKQKIGKGGALAVNMIQTQSGNR
jgi:hypothetical protein